MARQYADQVTIMGVAGRDTVERMQEFVDRHGLAGHVVNVADLELAVWEAWGVAYQPAWVFIDADGGAEVVPGALDGGRLEARVEAFVAQG